MKKFPVLIALLLCTLLLCTATVLGADEKKIPPMPAAVSGNAVASLKDGLQIFSMMGVGPRKTWDDITNQVYVMNLAHANWSEGRTVPGAAGRLNAAAAGAKDVIVLMGGYVVDGQGGELTVSDVNVYEPGARRWSRGKDIPTPVDSAVVGVTRDRFVYLIGGRAPSGPVNNVQVYDVEKDSWSQATPFPGTPVFGLSGGIANDEIVVVDGAKPGPAGGPRYVASDECWLGKVNRKDPNRIEWSKLPAHPGPAHFAIAGGGSSRDHRIFFSGGTATPHDFKGVAYDGQPAQASDVSFAYDLHGHKWETTSENTYDPRADSRGILMTPIGPQVLGGMVKNLAVTARVTPVPKK
ncbi:MAG TPA: kelch repeat-containing protein [Candidatus Acidoferrum sp.]|nr:kelch repeat-containing protein [Candidatus Acidoferrum sp.]